MLRFLKRWFDYLIPSDESLEYGAALPKTLEELKARREQIETCRQVAFDALAARNTTQSPIHRRGA